MSAIESQHFTGALFFLLDETFDNVQGAYLDKGDSMFETLATITAEEASIPVGGRCATLAAQVKHTAFYLDVVVNSVRDPNMPPADWDAIWNTVKGVTPAEWQQIQSELRASYDRIKELISGTPAWTSERQVGGAIAVVAHTAFHLGQIRQSLCVLKH